MITRHTVAQKIFDYLNHSIGIKELVDWCENVMMDGEIEENDTDAVNDVVARIGVADVANFGLLWEDCSIS
jgi:ABC-type transport system involved in cytochrome c biogenesis ATPase subunit